MGLEICAIVYAVNRTINTVEIISLLVFICALLKNILLSKCKTSVIFSYIDRKVNLKRGKYKNNHALFLWLFNLNNDWGRVVFVFLLILIPYLIPICILSSLSKINFRFENLI